MIDHRPRVEACVNCGATPAYARGRCKACCEYLRRNKVDRPEEMFVRAGRRALEREALRRIVRAALGGAA